MNNSIGETILHYKIIKKLGEGGMGVVYLAEDTKLERQVAIKFLPRHIAAKSDERKRFEIEAKAAAALNHPNIATIYAIEEADEEIFIVMEYIDGQELKEEVRSKKLEVGKVLEIAVQIAEGLQAAHKKDVVHRDIKSANIMVTEECKIKIMDFGLAKVGGGAMVTKTGTTLGTAAYMSPEQARGDEIDQKSDIWSFGVVMYEMLTGQLPFKGEYEQAVTYSIVNENPNPISEVRSDLPHELETIVNKCLEKKPPNRYQHVDDMLVDLRKIVKESETKEILSQTGGIKTQPQKQSHSFILPGIIALVVLLFISGYFFFSGEEESGEKISIAVVDFVNETDEKELNSLSGMLITALEQSRRLSVLTRSRMFDILNQLGKKDVDYINEKMGMEICKQANIEVLAVASIRKLGNRYAIDLKVLNPHKNEHLVTAKEEDTGQEKIFAMIDQLAEKIRKGLNEKAEEIQAARQNVADVTTTNLAAYEHYFQGEQLLSKIKFNQAIEEFKKAVFLDSTFALAYYRLGYAYGWNTITDLAREALAKARSMINRIPEKERYILRSEEAHLEGVYEAAIPILEEGVERYPNDKEILYVFGDALYHEGRYDESIKYLEKVLEMDPAHERALNHILLALRANKLYDRAIDYGKQYVQQSHSSEAFADLALSYIYAGNFNQALETCRKGIEIYPENPNLQGGIGRIYIYQGEYEEAEKYLKSMIGEEKSNSIRIQGYSKLADLYAYLGKYNLMMNMYDNSIELYRQENNMHMVADHGIKKAFLMIWGRGKKDGVLKEVEKTLEVKNPGCLLYNLGLALIYIDFQYFDKAYSLSEQFFDENFQQSVKTREYFNKKEWEKAIYATKAYGNYGRHPTKRYQIAQCYFELGNWQKAIEEIEAVQNLYSGFGWWNIYPKTFYLLGKIYEKKGDISLAIENYEKLLDIWKDADKDLPDLIDAQKRYAGLVSLINSQK